jgi:hypothetical protein
VLSLPTLTQVSTKIINDSSAIEDIFLASSKLNQIVPYCWDKNSSDLNATIINLSTDIKRVTITITKASTVITSLNAITFNIKKTKPYHKTF